MHQPGQAPTPDGLVPAYCERCGEVVTGLHPSDELPFHYVCGMFTLYVGTCAACRDVVRGQGGDRAVAALAESEERYGTVSELMSDWVYAVRFEPSGEVIREWATEAYVWISGYTSGELDASGGWVNVVHLDDRPIMQERVEALCSGRPHLCEYRIVTKSGGVRSLRDYGRPVSGEMQSQGVTVYGAAQDITERKQMVEDAPVTAYGGAIKMVDLWVATARKP